MMKNLLSLLAVIRIKPEINNILAYIPLPSEISILDILSRLGLKNIFFPRIVRNQLLPYKIHLLRSAGGQIRVCHTNYAVACYKIDLVIVPALFVDRCGYRLGRGGGYYDRLLRFFPLQKTCFLGYDWQCIDMVPREKHDRRIAYVVTQSYVKACFLF